MDITLNEMRAYKRDLEYTRTITDFDLVFSIRDTEQIEMKMAGRNKIKALGFIEMKMRYLIRLS